MSRSSVSNEQIIAIVKEQEADTATAGSQTNSLNTDSQASRPS
jgi:hypothetical protein